MTDASLLALSPASKCCSKCGELKALSEYYIDKRSGAHVSQCRSCIYKRTSAYQKNNPDKAKQFWQRYRGNNPEKHQETVRNYRLRNPEKLRDKSRRHGRKRKLAGLGMTVADLQREFDLQNGMCAICENTITLDHGERGQSAHIDHCHKANTFRGILCSYCNVGLGCFSDSPDKLKKAISYLNGTAVDDQGL